MEKDNKKANIRKDDLVFIRSGNSRGATGKVLRVLGDKVVVQGVNVRTKHVKPVREKPGALVKIEAPIHRSNVCLAREISKN